MLDELGPTSAMPLASASVRRQAAAVCDRVSHDQRVRSLMISSFQKGYWRIGHRCGRETARFIHFDRSYTTEMDFTVWADGRGLHPFIQPSYVFPAEPGRSNGALEYARWWNTGGKEGIKPEGDILRMMELYQEFVKEPDPDVRLEIGRDLIELSARTILGIGTVGLAPIPVVAKDNLRNVPEDATRDWVWSRSASQTGTVLLRSIKPRGGGSPPAFCSRKEA